MESSMNNTEQSCAKISYLEALKKNPEKKMSDCCGTRSKDLYFLDVNLDIEREMNKIIKCINNNNVVIEINKMISFYPMVQQIKKKIRSKFSVTFLCLPYGYSRHEYSVVLKGWDLEIYINKNKIDTSEDSIVINEKNIDNNFILDIFRFFDNVNIYKWHDDDVCDFHKNRSSAQYGIPGGNYKRVKKNIVEIVTYGCCCNYSGDVSYFDIDRNESKYASCGCFIDQDEIDDVLSKCRD